MTLRANPRPIKAEHKHQGPLDLDHTIRLTVAVRRRLDHAPIPSFDDYVGCPERKRLSEEEFAEKYGASEEDLQKVVDHYEFFGFTCDTHTGSRHVYLEGSVELVNEAFGVELHAYETAVGDAKLQFHKYEGTHFIPDHLDEIAIYVGDLDTEQLARPPATVPAVESILIPSQVQAFYSFPSGGAAGQVIGIPRFNLWGTFNPTGPAETNSLWGSPIPTITQITIDTITNPGTSIEIPLDVGMCQIFAPGCAIVIYDTASFEHFINRVLHPQSGEPQCTVISASYAQDETAIVNANVSNLLIDCAIQGITVCAASGDWGTSSSVDYRIVATMPSSNPYVLGIGGTVLGANSGTVSISNFVEWCWNVGSYEGVTGGGVSILYAQPEYQNFTMPTTTTNSPGRTLPPGAPGRGSPDIAAIAEAGCGVRFGVATGQDGISSGTSGSTPIMAALIACINKSVGYNIGFVNPTIYKYASTVIRNLDPGGPTDNTFTNDVFGGPPVVETGYPVNIGAWGANVGLGMLKGTALISVLSGGETPSIITINLSSNSVTCTPTQPNSVPSSTVIGSLSTVLSSGSGSASYSVSGTNANSFQILSGNNLGTLGTVNVGTYIINVVAAGSSFLNSPFTQAETITVIASSPTILSINLSTTTYALNLAQSSTVAIVTVTMSDGSAYIGGYTLGGTDAGSFFVGDSFTPGDSNTYLYNNVTLSNSSYNFSITCSEGNSNLTKNFQLTTTSIITITGVTLSNTTYTQGAASGTLVGTIAVQASGGTFTGTLSLSGTNASSFQLSGNSLLTQGSVTAASYSINIVATQSGAAGSPFTQAFTITQVSPSAVLYIVEQSSGTAGPWNAVAGSPFSGLTDTVSGLTPGTSYYFRITPTDTALNLLGPQAIVGPVKTVSNVAESAQGTKLTTTTGTIVDATGGVWSLVLNVTPPGSLTAGTITQNSVALAWVSPTEQIQVDHPDGTRDGTNVVELLYWNHTVYRDDANGWTFWNGTGWTAAPGDPSLSSSESANGTTVTNSTETITDSVGSKWTLGGSSSSSNYVTPGNGSVTLNGNTYTLDSVGDFEQNGVIVPGGSGTSAIDLYNNTIYAQDATTGTWYIYNPSNQVFTQAASPPGNLPGSNGQQVVHNGVTDNTTSQVQELLYWNHVVYYETTSGNWFDWTGTTWASTTNPMQQGGGGGAESPNGIIVSNTTNSITDANGAVWTLVTSASSGLQVAENGIVDTVTAQVQELLYWNHAVYQEAANPNDFGITPGWWFWNGSMWVSVNGDPSATVVTWSASDKSSQITLSTDKLTCNTTAAGEEAIRSTVGYSSGKYYFETTITAGNGDSGVGIANSQFPLNYINQLGGSGTATGVGYYALLVDRIYTGATNPVSQGVGSDSLPTVVSCAVDFGAKLIWFTSTGMRGTVGITWNNSTTANPATGTGGVSFSNLSAGPYFVCANDDVGGSTFIVNFGATSFSFSIPSGFQPWSPGVGATGTTTANPTFSDDFTTLSLYNTRNTAAGGTWEPAMWYATDGVKVGNGTWCVNPFNPATPFNNIYTVNNSILSIALEATPSGFAAACGNLPAVSGNLQTSTGFSQTYGYFEMRCAWPGLQGTSFDFYLMNTVSWPPELDIVEIYDGIFTQTVHFTSTTSTQWANRMSTNQTVSGADLTQMHQYGVDWESDFITFYFDRVQTFQIPTPSGYNAPMFPIIDYTAGTSGDYVGQPNYASLPVSMQIDYVKAWQKRPF